MTKSLGTVDVADRNDAFGASAIDAVMKAAIAGLIDGAAASTAFADVTMWTQNTMASDVQVARNTARMAEGADVSPIAAGMAANADRTMKAEPRALVTDAQRQLAVESATIPGAGGGYRTRTDGLAADRLGAAASAPKALASDKERQLMVESTTISGAGGGYRMKMDGLAADRLRGTRG